MSDQITRVSNEWQLNDSAVFNALAPWFEKRLNKLPREQRRYAEAYIPAWPDLSPAARRAKAEEVNRQRALKLRIKFRLSEIAKNRAEKDPKQVAEGILAWYDCTLDAAAWWRLGAVTPCEAAMLLCQFNPHDDAADPLNTTTDIAGPDDYRRLLRSFEDIEKRNPQHRTLLQWLGIARDMKLEYHSWIDEYKDSMATIAPPQVPDEAQEQTAPSGTTEKAAPLNNAQARLSKIVDALELHAKEAKTHFDRQAMPGPLGENWQEEGSFHWLCARMDPTFRRARDTFKKHRAGICALEQYAQPTDFYRLALPRMAPILDAMEKAHKGEKT